MEIKIILHFPEAEKNTEIWAKEEGGIDFRNEHEIAARCTIAFAATELKNYLVRTLNEVNAEFSSECKEDAFNIDLKIGSYISQSQCFSIYPMDNGMEIEGEGRIGLLYGGYEFLRMQGWRWLSPGKAGEVMPEVSEKLIVPDKKINYSASMNNGRGFDFEYVSMESEELFLWMARNRLNLVSYRPSTGAFCKKLGMIFKMGGHIFEKILDPGKVMPTGRTLWEDHKEWYGIPSDGIRTKERALSTQFCVCHEDLMEYLGEELLFCLNGKWKEADRVDIWGFDTWGSSCTCSQCVKLGNDTDRTVYLISRMRNILDKALEQNRLSHDVQLVMCAYEGTSSLYPPKNPIPENLIKHADMLVYYPINRCYAHELQDEGCGMNRHYDDALKGWLSKSPTLPVIVGEYYNVSKFEDLPLLFTGTMVRDIPEYYALGVRGMTYMHLPMVNWGVRTLTQVLYAQLCWDVNTDAASFINEYFRMYYGSYGDEMKEVYALVEEAWKYISSWRAWNQKSALSRLLAWNGKKPEKDLELDEHFKTLDHAIAEGKKSVKLMKKALIKMEVVYRKSGSQEDFIKWDGRAIAVNPVQAREMEIQSRYELRIGEDRRLHIYGLDTITLMTEMLNYYNALYGEDAMEAEKAWDMIEKVSGKMDSYFLPIGYEWPGAGIESKDALTRSQLRDLVKRCRMQKR